MKFLIDENLPMELSSMIADIGHQVLHVNQIKKALHSEKVLDGYLRKYSIYKDYVMVSRDFDFVDSWRSRKVPEKLIFVHADRPKAEMIGMLKEQIPDAIRQLSDHDLIEVGENGIRTPFSEQRHKK